MNLMHIYSGYLELRQYKNDSIQLKKISFEIVALFCRLACVGDEKERQYEEEGPIFG